jgi:integrase
MANTARAWVRKSHRTKDLHPSKQKWEVLWTDPEATPAYKKRTKGGFQTRSAAQDWADDFLNQTRSGTYTDPTRATITFHTIAKEWLAAQHFDRRHTANGYRRIIEGNNDLMETFGSTPIGDITYSTTLRYIKDAATTKAPQTVRHRFYVLRTVLDYAVHNRLLPTNVARSVPPRTLPTVRRMKAHEEQRYPLTTAETDRIIQALPEPHDMFTRLVADAWLRPEEATGLTLADVDLDEGIIRVRTVIVEVQGELFREDATKTHKSRRDIDLSTPTLRELERYIAEHRARATKWFASNPEHVHPGEALPLFVGLVVGGAHGRPLVDRLDYSKVFRYSSLDRHWRSALKVAGVPHMRFYDLRHAGISRHVDRIGQDGALTLKEIQERAGHGSAVMTLDRYAHTGRPDRAKRRRALDTVHIDSQDTTNVTPITSKAKRTG